MSNHLILMHIRDIDYQAYQMCSFYHELHDKQARINFFTSQCLLKANRFRQRLLQTQNQITNRFKITLFEFLITVNSRKDDVTFF